MILQKMKSGKISYFSSDLLDQGEGINGFSNVVSLEKEYGSTSKRVFNSNITYNEKTGYFNLEHLSDQQIPQIIIEEDMFGKQKIWLKESETSSYILNKIETDLVINKKIKDKIFDESLVEYFQNNKIMKIILENVDEENNEIVINNENGIFKNFKTIIEKSTKNFLIDDGKCQLYLNKEEKDIVIDKLNDYVKKSLSTQKLLLSKNSDNELKKVKKSNNKQKI